MPVLPLTVLRAYFYSGWAFLIPYLLTYLLYAWRKWPANPAPLAGSERSTVLGPLSVVNGPWSFVPCLLHVYWAFHAINLIFAALALRRWWRDARRAAISDQPLAISSDNQTLRSPSSALTPKSSGLRPHISALDSASGTEDTHGPSRFAPNSNPSGFRFQLSAFSRTALPALPWALLALIFAIPGVYLEWPSDPWEHLRRINEWHTIDQVTAHSAWKKSSYFLPYSLTGQRTGLSQLSWLNLYYTSACLLLSWQYYRLARAVGLGQSPSFTFVILNVLTFGNNIFSFCRYYGLSSSIIAQIGAVALTRICLEALSTSCFESTAPSLSPLSPTRHARLRSMATVLLLFTLIVFNHIQGIGIAGLGILAVVIWRLIDWTRAAVYWLVPIAIGCSLLTIYGYSGVLARYEIYREQHWLTLWYGFNLLEPASPAFERAATILGVPGFLNLLAAFWLFRSNHVVAWLTVMPYIALCMPFVSLPYVQQLISSDEPILVFHRTFFAVPSGLALVVVYACRRQNRMQSRAIVQEFSPSVGRVGLSDTHRQSVYRIIAGFFRSTRSSSLWRGFLSRHVVTLGIGALVLLPAGKPSFNRLYNLLSCPPNDLSMYQVLLATKDLGSKSLQLHNHTSFIATTGVSFVAGCAGVKGILLPTTRSTFALPRDKTVQSENYLASFAESNAPAVFLLQSASKLYTPLSHSGYLSQHWHPLEVAFEHSSGPEAERIAKSLGYRNIEINNSIYYVHAASP